MAVLVSRDLKEELVDLNEMRKTVENAESRARLEHKNDAKVDRNDREFAQALHREAEQLYQSGDYESALVLYHRAANLFPRDSSHSVAVSRTAATISSCNNPTKALRKVLPYVKTEEGLAVSLCPELAAIQANDKLKKSPDPSSVAEALSYFDTHKSYWKTLPSPRLSTMQLTRLKTMLRQLSSMANTYLENLETAFNSGKMSASLKIAQELLVLSAGLEDPTRYQIGSYHYLSLIHMALGRHDRAVCNVSRLIRLSKSTGDVVQFCRSLVTLGKVHLSFGHLNAAAKAWDYLSKDLRAPIPVAWIRHEIGRCYLETGKYEQALDMACGCIQAAMEGKSKKWTLYGRLLLGQSLVKLGKFVEALDELQIVAKITEEEGDNLMLSYIQDLIDQVTCALRRIALENGYCGIEESKVSLSTMKEEDQVAEGRSELFTSRTETIITTMYSQRVITECRDGGSSSETSVDEEITTRSDSTKGSVQTYQESSGRSGLENDRSEVVLEASSGFRVQDLEEIAQKQDNHEVRLSSSIFAFSDEEFTGEAEYLEDYLIELAGNTEINEEAVLSCVTNKSSMRSVDTNAIYVIEKEAEIAPGKVKRELDNGSEQKGISWRSDKGCEESAVATGSVVPSDKTVKEGILNAFRVLEELEEKKEVELLEMVKDMLLPRDEKDRSCDLGNSGDAGGENYGKSRSSEDSRDKVAACRALYKHSLPSSCEIYSPDGDFHSCEETLESD